uniref:Uncharacterized protein n=1 Tax=Tetranychus urticae TaxID=32264 RepID=T1JZX7_TETUR
MIGMILLNRMIFELKTNISEVVWSHKGMTASDRVLRLLETKDPWSFE